MNKSDCNGCYHNDYNNGLHGITKCWSFDQKKKLEKRYAIPVDLSPPYGKDLIIKVPPCYSKPRYAYVRQEAFTKEGYWKS